MAALLLTSPEAWSAEDISFNRDVRPILSNNCFACHGPDSHDRKGRLRLDEPDGDLGAYREHRGSVAIAPGSPEESEVWRRITSTEEAMVMPPPESHMDPLSEEDQAVIKRWIKDGAQYEDFWAFVPPEMPTEPEVRNPSWSDQRIDRHVLAGLESAGLAPSPEADRRTLIRRLTFDLTGLPPTPKEVRAFLDDPRPDAYERLVDRLIASPRYGEHAARYWLDLVRFADTSGMHKDFYRNNTAYRDWVIRAFNDNLPYDQLLRYQLAGDLLPDATEDQLIASSFNRLHLIIDVGTALPEESFYKNVVDRVTAVGTAFMGLTLQCAACHDHKYDPVTEKDFYSLFAFFNNIDAEPEIERGVKDGLQPPLISIDVDGRRRDLDAGIAVLQSKLDEAIQRAENARDPGEKLTQQESVKKMEGRMADLRQRRDALNRTSPKAMVMKERDEVRPTHVMNRGQYDDPGELVTRNTPEFLPPLRKSGEVATQLDLAEWFVDRDHPLTARVAVNRFWQQFFGVGIVKTSEDFGAQGEVPRHPELLDYLAVSFMDSGWDIKALTKEIVMSKTYRQSSVAGPEKFRSDPENRLLARGSRFRMDAEMIRDQILATNGLLSPTMYGKSVKPPQPPGLWESVTMTNETYKADAGDAIYRRSLYTYWKRAMPPPQMTILNAPIRDACISRRERTSSPTQALLLLNENQWFKAAQTLAESVLAEPGLSRTQRIDLAYETVTSNLPGDAERAEFATLLDDLGEHYLKNPDLAAKLSDKEDSPSPENLAQLAAWTVLVNTLYNLDITKTRQ